MKKKECHSIFFLRSRDSFLASFRSLSLISFHHPIHSDTLHHLPRFFFFISNHFKTFIDSAENLPKNRFNSYIIMMTIFKKFTNKIDCILNQVMNYVQDLLIEKTGMKEE